MTRARIAVAVAVALMTFTGSVAAQKSTPSADAIRAARFLSSWRHEQARPLISRLENTAPDAPQTRYLKAELSFLDGHYKTTLELLDGLEDDAVFNNVGHLRSLATSTIQATSGHERRMSSGGHFEIWFPPGKDEVLVDLAGDVLEAAYEALGDDFGFRPTAPVRVEFLARPQDLARVSTLTENDIDTTGTIALCKYNKLMVVTPRATLFGYPWMDTLTHEYVHYVVSSVSGDKVPVWLHEGLARFQQVRWRGAADGALSATDEHLLATALRKRRLISFDDMHPSMAKLPSQEAAALAFAEVHTLVSYVHAEQGYPGLKKALDRIRRGRSARRAVAEVMGRTWGEVEDGWKEYLRKQKLRPRRQVAAKAGSQIRFRKGVSNDDENVGADQLTNKKALKFTRLGGMLRARGMLAAAAMEYEKALAAAGVDNAFIAGKLSRTYLDLQNYERAITLAEPLVAEDPDDASLQTALGVAYRAAGRTPDAQKAFEAALRISPFDAIVRCGLAQVYKTLGRAAPADREQRACQRLKNE